MRAPALYEFKAEGYNEKLEPFQQDLTDRVGHFFLNEKSQASTFLGETDE